MPRDESTREDLLSEATALVERIELVPRHVTAGSRIVVGFRRDGALSIFFGEDPVYQFNAAGELRRAYYHGKLLKAERGQLVSLDRVRTPTETQLVRYPLSAAETDVFLTHMSAMLYEFAFFVVDDAFKVVGQVPSDADVLGRLRAWLSAHRHWPIAAHPNA